MGIRDDIDRDIKEAFDGDLADAVKSAIITIVNRITPDYDPTTGVIDYDPETVNVRGVLYDTKSDNIIDSAMNLFTARYMMLISEYTGSRPPQLGDGFEITVGGQQFKFKIAITERDPVDATYILGFEST